MDRKLQLWLIGGFIVVVILAVGAAAYFSNGAPTSSTNFVSTTVPPITSADHITGDANSKVSVIEYGDFECPACGEWEPLMEQLRQQYGNSVEFVFRNFPLYQIHPFAMIGAQAAEAAALQGQYWQMHDLLYKDQAQWTANTTLTPADVVSQFFNGYATSLGLNVTQFDTDINSSAVQARVQRDLTSGNAAQIDHTPTFFVNLQQIQNPTGLAQFQQIIQAALASSSSATSQATSSAAK
jgi:protein-disulfide isomerase